MQSIAYARIAAAFVISCSVGCSAVKERTGEFVTEAVVENVITRLERRLDDHGQSLDKLRSIADVNSDSRVDRSEIIATAKAAVRDLVSLQVERHAISNREEWERATKDLVTIKDLDDLKRKSEHFWSWIEATLALLGTTVIGCIVKGVSSSKKDGKRDARMALLESLLQKDLDGDGVIGSVAAEEPKPDKEN